MNKRGHSVFSTAQNKQNVPNKERGFILVSVIIAITLVAAIAFALSQQGASETNIATGELQRDQLRYVAEAGFAHAKLQLSPSDTCDAYANIRSTGFGAATYAAKVSPAEGSPVSVTATGTLTSGAQYTLRRDDVKVYRANAIQTISMQPGTEGDDAEIWDQEPNSNYGDSGETWVSSASDDTTRSLLRFSIGTIPAGVKIMEATLSLYRQSGSGADQPVSAHRIMKSWSEDAVTWNSRVSGTNWDTAGGDFDNDAVATTLVGPANQRYEWNITPLVQGWVDGSYPNYGVALAAAIAGMPGERFSTSDGPILDKRPGLSVRYACECGKACGGGASKNLLLVVGDPASLTAQQQNKKTLIEDWGHSVTLIATSESQAAFDTAAALVDVVYIPELGTTPMSELGTKADNLAAGVITEEARQAIKLGSFQLFPFVSTTSINIVDNTHFITATLPTGNAVLSTATQSFWKLGGTLAPDLHILGELTGAVPGLAYVDIDETVNDGNPAPGRRVKLPWGASDFDVTLLTDDARTIMRRAIEWGARGPQENPVAHWKFDDGSGLTALDSEGGHDGALVNGPAWVPGKLDTALDFDGSDDVVEVPQTSDLDLSTFTVSAWIRISTLTSSQTILEKRDGADLATVNYLLLAAGNEITWAFYDGGWASFSTDTANMEVDTWYHVAGTYDNSTGEGNVYVNGVLLASGTTTKNPPLVPGSVRIGDSECAACNDKWNGSLDDVRIYNRALSASEVADLFDTGSGAGYYLDEFNSLNCDPASDYTGSDGSRDWSGWQWQETLDDSGSCSGDIKILVDGGSNRLQLKGDGSGIERRVDLTAFSVATLSFDYLQDGPFDATRYLSVWASADAGSNWTEVGRIDVEGDGTYKSASFDISAHVGPNAMIRFETADLQATRKIYIDNVHIDDVPTGGGGGGGEVTFEEFTDASLSSDGLSITIPKPAGTAAGDLLIAAIVTDGENKPAMTAPAGWTLIDHDKTSKQVTMDVLWKIADASEPGSYDFSWEKSQEAYGWIMRFTGHDPTAPIHDSQSDGGTSSSPVSPAVSTTTANTMIVRIGGFDDDDITPGDPGLSGHTAITMGASDTGTGTASGGAGYVLQSGTGGQRHLDLLANQ